MNTQANLNLLRVLYSLLNTKSTVGAAKELNITQPAVSKQLNQLRELFQDPIICRYGSHNELTPKAESLRVLVSETVGNLNTLFENRHFDPSTSDFHLNIATDSGIIRGVIADILATIHTETPKFSITFLPASDRLVRRLNKGMIDLYIGHLPIKADIKLEEMVVVKQPVRCFMSTHHPLAKTTSPDEILNPEDLQKYTFICDRAGFSNTPDYDKYIKGLGIVAKEQFSVLEAGSAMAAAKNTSTLLIGAYHLSPEYRNDILLTSRKLPGDVPCSKLGLAWPKYKNYCQKHGWVRERITELWNEKSCFTDQLSVQDPRRNPAIGLKQTTI